MRTGMGLTHWKRVEGSKYAHCLQQCRAVWHLGHSAGKSEPAVKRGGAIEAARGCYSLHQTRQARTGDIERRTRAGRAGAFVAAVIIVSGEVAVRFLIAALLVLAISVHVADWRSLKCKCSSRAAWLETGKFVDARRQSNQTWVLAGLDCSLTA